jgi:hypothetical protein
MAPAFLMALDAFVYCDCFEKENLRCSPPADVQLRVAPNGEITCSAPTDRAWFAFTNWRLSKACSHPAMILKHHRLGTAHQITPLRQQLRNDETRFPILLNKILYSDTHTCDWIPLPILPQLTEELKHLDPPATPQGEALRHLKIQLAELIIAAQMANKPICF